MKYTYYIYVILAAGIVFASCRRQPSTATSEGGQSTTEEWMQADPAACMKQYCERYAGLCEQELYDSAVHEAERVIRAIPLHPRGNRDSLRRHTCRLLDEYLRTLLFRKPDYRRAARFTDSLLHAGHPFLSDDCAYELATYAAYAYSPFDRTKARQMCGEFVALPEPASLDRVMKCCNMVAWVYYFCSKDRFIPVQERAVAAYRAGGSVSDNASVLSRMSYFYRRAGRYEEAAELIREALELYHSRPEGEQPPSDIVTAYGDYSTLYLALGLYDKALDANTNAIAYSRRKNNYRLVDLYRTRALLFVKQGGQWDSVFHCLAQGEQFIDSLSNAEVAFNYRFDRYTYRLAKLDEEAAHPSSDSLLALVAEIEALCADTAGLRPSTRVQFRKLLGTAWLRRGTLPRNSQQSATLPHNRRQADDLQAGIRLLESAYHEAVSTGWAEWAQETGEELMKAYIAVGSAGKLKAFHPSYRLLSDSLHRDAKLRYAVAANIRYETGRKEQENRALTAELTLHRHRLVYTWIIGGLVFILVLTFTVQQIRLRRRETAALRNEINALLDTQKRLNALNEQLGGKSGMAVAAGSVAGSAAVETAAAVTTDAGSGVTYADVDLLLLDMETTLLSKDQEQKFRRLFNSLYPRFLFSLRRLSPDLTGNDELVCMLIVLDRNTDEIALTLGVSRNTVNATRYRLRKKLGLEKDERLDGRLRKIRKR